MYKLTKSTSIIRLADNASIPNDPTNRDYQEYLGWVAAGNTPAPAQTPAESLAQAKSAKLAQLQQARDKAAAANVTVQGKVFSAETKIVDLFAKLADRLRRGKTTKLAAILTVDGTPVQVTQQLLEQIEDAIAGQREIAWNKYGTLVAQVNAATTVAQVHAVVW